MTIPSNKLSLLWEMKSWTLLSIDELHSILALRQAVFVVEQECAYLDIDGLDPGAQHLSATEDGQLIAYLRCLSPGTVWPAAALGRIVVAPAARGRDLGRELVRQGLRHCLKQWPDAGIEIGAQTYLHKFYVGLGFESAGEEYIEDGIPHVHMIYRGDATVATD